MKKVRTSTAEETIEFAAKWIKGLKPPLLIAVIGQLGAGKTQFIKGIGKGIGIDPAKICSASFVISAEYTIGNKKLLHIDAYRLKSPEELIDIGWYDIIGDESAIVAVEWADKIEDILPERYIRVEITIPEENSREITIREVKTHKLPNGR